MSSSSCHQVSGYIEMPSKSSLCNYIINCGNNVKNVLVFSINLVDCDTVKTKLLKCM